MTTINEINYNIKAKGNELVSTLKNGIIGINVPQSHTKNASGSKDVPSRPWMITGTACTLAGVTGMITSDSRWPYFVGVLGLASLAVGFSKRTAAKVPNTNAEDVNVDEIKAFVIDRSNNILDQVKNDWNAFMDATKKDVQQMIKDSSLSDDRKEELLSKTYYPETLTLSTLPLLDKLDSIRGDMSFSAQIVQKKTEFANEVALSVINSVNNQINLYNQINI